MAEGIKPKCDFCDKPAIYDGKTTLGPWAFMCGEHFERYGINEKGLVTALDTATVIPTSIVTKRCSLCGQVKNISEFYKYTDYRGIERYRPECKACNLKRRARKRG